MKDFKAKFLVALLLLAAVFILVYVLFPSLFKGNNEGGQRSERQGGRHGVSVIVPCIPQDVSHLSALINNINQQTSPPVEVVIGLSETAPGEALRIEKRLNGESKGYKVKIDSTTRQAYAGPNRNRAVAASSGNVLAFIDADDKMHPQRLEIAVGALGRFPKAAGVIHGHNWIDMSDRDFRHAPVITPHDMFLRLPDDRNKGFAEAHNGHPVLRREVFDSIQYGEAPRGQDTQFIQRLFRELGGVAFIDAPLSLYIARDKKERHKISGHQTGRATSNQ